MKKKLIFLSFLACLLAGTISSCSKDEPSNSDKPTTPNPNTPVKDPANTVTINLLVGQTNRESVELGFFVSVYIDNAYNLCGGGNTEIVDLGPVAGLGNITSAPQTGWKESAAAIVGHGYVMKSNYDLYGSVARLYIEKEMVSTGGGVMGYTVKYQCPMDNEFTLEKYGSCSFEKIGGEERIKINSGTGITVKSKPDWADVSISDGFVIITVPANDGDYREGYLVLSNPTNYQSIRLYQSGN